MNRKKIGIICLIMILVLGGVEYNIIKGRDHLIIKGRDHLIIKGRDHFKGLINENNYNKEKLSVINKLNNLHKKENFNGSNDDRKIINKVNRSSGLDVNKVEEVVIKI